MVIKDLKVERDFVQVVPCGEGRKDCLVVTGKDFFLI